ncbi:hypothetical protein KKB44_00860 [Candidatus Micrarchaeota archaeon]|nr:hypothetical protein [Candidatus Micrarchaeota archaeon]
MLNIRTILGLVFLFVVFAGCIIPGQVVRTDAIAVWQHDGDIYYSVWDHDGKAWYVPGGFGISAPIATDSDADYDPDVSSNEKNAIAVWTKGGNTIYYSFWENSVWSAPTEISNLNSNTDPTVAMDPSGNALAVWVTGQTSLSYSYYKTGIGWTTPSAIETNLAKVSLPEVAFNPQDGIFYLVFTGNNATSTNAYALGYSTTAGWSLPALIGTDAVLDNNLPTNQRTGVSAAENNLEVTMVWPGAGEIYSITLGGSGKNFDAGAMPDVAYDYNDDANGAYTRQKDLYHQPDVNTPTTPSTISTLSESDDRASLTFIRDRTIGLVVWWNEVVSPGQIYYSYYEGGNWNAAAQLDISLEPGLDRNPAVTPLRRIVINETIQPFCGDGILQWPWEQCEVGIPCPNLLDWCNLADCQCYSDYPPPNDSLSCYENSWVAAFGMSMFVPGMMCFDDCNRLGNEYECDMTTCECEKKVTNLSCSLNSMALAFGPAGLFAPGMICVDDCDELGDEYICDMTTCACVEDDESVSCSSNTWGTALGAPSSFHPGMMCQDDCDNLGDEYVCDFKDCVCVEDDDEPVSCSGNTWGMAFGATNQFAAGMLCRDDCENLGDNLECDFTTCLCEEEDDGPVYCAAHTKDVIATDVNNFDATTMICEDNCKELGEDYECNLGSCTCTRPPPKQNTSCFGNSFDTIVGTTNGFNPQTMICVDNCKEYLGTGFYCDIEPCTCTTDEVLTCAGHTLEVIETDVNNFNPNSMICYDNCEEQLGSEYECNLGSCTCTKKPKEDVSCSGNTMEYATSYTTGNQFDPSSMQCVDDCEELFDVPMTCNAETCVCEPSYVSCKEHTSEVDATDVNTFNPADAMICEDDCATGYECVVDSCTCVKRQKNVTCSGNTMDFGFSYTTGNQFDSSAMQCVDDCKEYFSNLDIPVVCDATDCICLPEKKVTCTGNTYDVAIYKEYNTFNPNYMICEDNCEDMGEGMYCDIKSCMCRKKPGTNVYCAANSDEAIITNALGVTATHFNSQTMQCLDNCKEIYGEGAVCDTESCYCVPDEGETVSCARYTGYVDATDVNNFNPQTMICEDDCEYLGTGYQCHPSSCTCTKTTRTPVSCSVNDYSTGSLDEIFPSGWYCKDDCDDGYECNANCNCVQSVEPVCGDGAITSPEECDYGSSTTNKCGEGEYCSESCMCNDLETSVVCGDGKISYPYEDCDGGNVKFNICPEGQECVICKCVGETAECGDGTVTPPEECDHGNSYTAQCPGAQLCSSCQCVDYEDTSHKECLDEECVSVTGLGQDECTYDYQCEEIEEGYCGDGDIGAGEECEDDNDCGSDEFCHNCLCYEIPSYCGNGRVDSGESCDPKANPTGCDETGVCSSGCKCVYPPSLDCEYVCSQTSGAQSFGGQYSSGAECKAGVGEYYGSTMCYLTCAYSWYYEVSNIAGEASCCCGMKKMFACENCPCYGQGCEPTCPPTEETCAANAPSWHSP